MPLAHAVRLSSLSLLTCPPFEPLRAARTVLVLEMNRKSADFSDTNPRRQMTSREELVSLLGR